VSATHKVWFFSGLDLGCAQDCTALAVLERTLAADPEQGDREAARYAVRHLERCPLGTPYPAIAGRLAALFAEAPLAKSTRAVDETLPLRTAGPARRRRRTW
jgi:hypothetical protein